MKAVDVPLGERLGIEAAQSGALPGGVSAGERVSRTDADSFHDEFKVAIHKMKQEEKRELEVPITKKSPSPENSAPPGANFFQKLDENELFVELRFSRNETAEMALRVPEPSSQSIINDNTPTEGVPVQTGGQTSEYGEGMRSVINGFEAAETMPLVEDEPSTRPERLTGYDAVGRTFVKNESVPPPTVPEGDSDSDGVGKMSVRNEPVTLSGQDVMGNTLPLTEDQWVRVDESFLQPLPQDEPIFGNTSSDSLQEFEAVSSEEPGIVSDATVFSFQAKLLASEGEDVAPFSNFPEMGRPEHLTKAINPAPATVPLDNALQHVSPEQLPQPAAAQDPEPLFDQIVQSVRFAQHAQTSELQIHLKPDFLGRLSIRVLSDLHGMRIEIKAENEVVRQVMQDNLADLQQRLAEKGFAFDHLSLLADPSWTSRREPEWPFGRSFNGLPTESETTAETLLEAVPLTKSGIIDYFA